MVTGVSGTGLIQNQTSDIQNQLLIKERNIRRLFDLIYTHKEISRATLATMTKLSPTTVSSLIDEMLSSALVLTSGVETSGKIGRRAILLQVNSERLQIPTVAWERDGFRYVLYDLLCNELETIFLPLNQDSDYAEELHQLIVKKSKKVVQERLGALCISIPAVLDINTHRIISTVLDVEGHEDFLVQVKKQFQSGSVIIGNESAFYAYAEKEFALSTRAQNVIYINVNVGVGAGIIYRGKIYRGSFGMAGEFGHMSVDMHGPVCTCGNRGCIERLVSTPRIIESVVEAIRAGGSSLVSGYCDDNLSKLTLPLVAQAFSAGDALVEKVIRQVANVLSFGITNVIRIFDPEILVIGGGIEILGPRFLEMVKEGINMNGSTMLASKVDIMYTKLPPSCKNRGAAKYYIDNIMRFTVRKTEDVIIC